MSPPPTQPPSVKPGDIPSKITRTIDLIVVHCSATPSGRWIGGQFQGRSITPAAKSIDNWHAERGFRRAPSYVAVWQRDLPHIGYHYVIDLDGSVQPGRHLQEVGAHVAGLNAASIGICLVGGAEEAARYTLRQWAMLDVLVTELRGRFLRANVVGHRDLSPDANGDGQVQRREWLKTCPGFDVAAWLARGRKPLPEQLIEAA